MCLEGLISSQHINSKGKLDAHFANLQSKNDIFPFYVL